jgi:hypothetical protein
MFGKWHIIILALVAVLLGIWGLAMMRLSLVSPSLPVGNEMESLRKVAPSLMRWTEVEKLNTGMKSPKGIAVGPDKSVYVVGDNTLEVFSPGQHHRKVRSLAGSPRCITVSPGGEIFLGVRDHVEALHNFSSIPQMWPSPHAGVIITSVAFFKNGLLAADAGNRIVWKYDNTGHITGSFGRMDAKTGAPGLIIPSPHLDVAVTEKGNIAISNPGRHEIEIYSPNGRLIRKFGRTGNTIDRFSGCCNPTDFAILPDGDWVTSEKGLPRVKVLKPDGALESVILPPDAFPIDPVGMDIATDTAAHVYVLDSVSHNILVFERK